MNEAGVKESCAYLYVVKIHTSYVELNVRDTTLTSINVVQGICNTIKCLKEIVMVYFLYS